MVPGYGNEQLFPDLQITTTMSIDAVGSFNGDGANTWKYAAPWLELHWNNGTTAKVLVQKGRDWENKKNTVIFTGLNNKGISVWGKKK